MAHLEASLNLNPDRFTAALHFGLALAITGDGPKALRWLRRATSIKPRADDAWGALYYLGSSDNEASHCLLLDLAERTISVSDIGAGIKFVVRQHPPTSPIEVTEEMLAQALSEARAVTADRFSRPFQLCACLGGWVPASDGGYDSCPNGCNNGIIWLG